MPDERSPHDRRHNLHDLARQACLLEAFLRRGDIEHARWMVLELCDALRDLPDRD